MIYQNKINSRLDRHQTNRLLRSVYNWMMIGLMVSGLTAFYASHIPAVEKILFGNPFMIWILLFVELGLVFAISAGMNKMTSGMAQKLFLLFSFVDGLTLSFIFLAYTETSIASTFFIASAMFGVMSLYGYFTDKDLTSWGSILFIGLIGLIIAMVVNFFLKSSEMTWIISAIGVIVFVGLTAYDTQKIKLMGEQIQDETGDEPEKVAVIGALALYLDFINLFLMLLQFLGNRR